MPTYIPYPKSKDTPSRLTRKQSRKNVFLKNKKMAKDAKKVRLAIKASQEQVTEE